MFRIAVLAVLVLVLVPGALAEDRVSATEKGSLLVYPKVEIRFNEAGYLTQDTFITLNNDFNAGVDIQLYFVSETCTRVDNVITLSKNEPAYWSVATGWPKGVSPWTVLGDPYPDPDGSGDMIMRGFILAWAIDDEYAQIRWNHLYGGATIVNYACATAWEYNAYAFAVVDENVANGDPIGLAGTINLDGAEYDYGFDRLLLDFFASGSLALTGDGCIVINDTDLTLLIVDMDLRQDGDGPKTTKAKFEIWNENEVGFSGMEFCFTKWIETTLSSLGSHFLVENLQTFKGRARIDGMESIVCDPLVSEDVVLLGVAAKYLGFLCYDGRDVAQSGTNLFGSGVEATSILYDIPDAPPEAADGDRTIGTFQKLRAR
jgi:hypothetical protein